MKVVALATPGQPSDRGASSLGLVMMLLAASVGSTALLYVILSAADSPSALGPTAVLVSLVRLGAHARAGRSLWLRDGRGARRTREYLVVALVHSLMLTSVVRDRESAAAAAIVLLTALGWPLAVAIAVAVRRLGDAAPAGDDDSIGGGERHTAAALFAIGGLVVTLPAVCALATAFTAGAPAFALIAGFLAVPGCVGLLALIAAREGLRDDAAFQASTSRAAWASSMLGGLLALLCIATIIGTLALPAVLGCLVVLPWLLSMHAARGRTSALGDREHGGATLALGWVLLAHGLALVAHAPAAAMATTAPGGTWLVFLASGWVVGSPLLHVALGAVELWLAIELIRGSPRARLAALVFVGAAVATAGTQWMSHLDRLEGAIRNAPRDDDHWRTFVYTLYAAYQLVVPAVTAWLVLRRQTSVATAVVHTREE